MKKVLVIMVLIVLFAVPTMAQEQQPDYKQMYLQERIKAIQLEMQVLQSRFAELAADLPKLQQELKVYLASKQPPDVPPAQKEKPKSD